jgi:glycosyltransferase involved in cell wall biosynthesis
MTETPRVYLISHYRERASEVWLQRVRASLAQHLVGEAYFDIGNASSNTVCNLMPAWWAAILSLGVTTDKKFAPPRKAALRRAITRSEANIVYCHFANLAVRLRTVWDNLDIPIVVHCHGFDVSFDLLNTHGRPRYRQNYPQQIAALSQRCHFIANSDFTRSNLLRHGVEEQRVLTWHFGVPPIIDRPQHIEEVTQILFLGRFIGCKGPVETLRAFANAVGRGLNAKLTMAGDGPLFQTCCDLAAELGVKDRVAFPGAVSAGTAFELFRSSQVFTAHSQRDPQTNQCEAFGVAFIEALSAALPVVNGHHAGPATFLEHEHDALLFPPGNVVAHADALIRICADHELRNRLARNALDKAARNFDANRQHALLLQYFADLTRSVS